MDFKKFYEWYHRDRKLPKRVIGPKNFTYRHIVSVLDKYCRAQDVLDVGSGVGTVDFYLAAKGKKVTGIEISKRAYDVAQKSVRVLGFEKNVEFKRVDFLKSKLEKRFGFIICSEVLEHLPDDRAALIKIKSLMKEGGLLFISVPSLNSPLRFFGLNRKFDEESGHLRRYTLESAKGLVKSAGLKVIYSNKTEGLIRVAMFTFRWDFLIKIANRVPLISDAITFLDDITKELFGESDIEIVARKVRLSRRY